MTRRVIAPLVALLVLLLAASAAHAGDAQLARQLTDRGIELQKEGQHARAVALFDAALAEVDHAKIRYFRAKSLRALGRYDEALEEFGQIKNNPQVAKYRDEIIAFMRDITNERERKAMEDKLREEQALREKLEAERKALEEQAEKAAVERLKAHKSGLYPPGGRNMEGTPTARIVPLIPLAAAPSGEYQGAIEVLAHAEALEAYESELTIAKALTVGAVVGVSVGVGLAVNPLGDGDVSDGTRQAGLAVGVVGLMSGLVAAVLWPTEPVDARPSGELPSAGSELSSAR